MSQPTGPIRPVPVILDADATADELLTRAHEDNTAAQDARDPDDHQERVELWQIGDPGE
ncbi:hypothetical protein [Streptomyces sp. LNU-CPARS28]|uniref:hypothetical protein n=1 Tax=Streptomyces sp. LNU-CPARS28 TaxID=3137371 RepID=UPI003136D23F